MRTKEELDSTNNSAVYRRLYKAIEASCSRCPWHKIENRGKGKPDRSWKAHRKDKYK